MTSKLAVACLTTLLGLTLAPTPLAIAQEAPQQAPPDVAIPIPPTDPTVNEVPPGEDADSLAEEPVPRPSAPAPAPVDSPLVAAAKAAKAQRQRSSTPKVITNADVKKSNGKLIVISSKPLPEEKKKPTKPASEDALYHARTDANARLTVAEKKVADLDKELKRLEQSFYNENDPNYRDDVIQKRFEQTRKQLDDAQRDLSNARDAQTSATTPPS